jgi:hypothetical protein
MICFSRKSEDRRALTEAYFKATVQDVIDRGVYKGVEFHDAPSAGAGASLEDFVATDGIGTD